MWCRQPKYDKLCIKWNRGFVLFCSLIRRERRLIVLCSDRFHLSVFLMSKCVHNSTQPLRNDQDTRQDRFRVGYNWLEWRVFLLQDLLLKPKPKKANMPITDSWVEENMDIGLFKGFYIRAANSIYFDEKTLRTACFISVNIGVFLVLCNKMAKNQ